MTPVCWGFSVCFGVCVLFLLLLLLLFKKKKKNLLVWFGFAFAFAVHFLTWPLSYTVGRYS